MIRYRRRATSAVPLGASADWTVADRTVPSRLTYVASCVLCIRSRQVTGTGVGIAPARSNRIWLAWRLTAKFGPIVVPVITATSPARSAGACGGATT